MTRSLFAGLCWLVLAPSANAADYLNGDWYILAGGDAVASSDPTGDVAKALAKEKGLKGLAFNADGDWAFLFGGNGIIYSGGMPPALVAKVPELWKVTGDFKCLAFRPQGGWLLLYDKNGFAQEGLPAGLRERLEKAQKTGETIRSVAFAPDGGWFLLLEKEFFAEGLPKPLHDRVAAHYAARIGVRCVAFDSRGEWFLIDAANNCFAGNVEHPAFKKLSDLRAGGKQLNWIAFCPGEYAHGYRLEHHPVQRVRAVLTQSYSRPEGGVNPWVVLPPQAPELPRQRDVKVALEPESLTVPDLGPLREDVRLCRIADRPKGFTAKTTYEMTLFTNRLVPRLASEAAGAAKLPPEIHAAFTHVTHDMTTKSFHAFLDKARLHKAAQEGAMAFARRTFLYIAKHFTYLYPNPEKEDVVDVGKGDCGGLSWVFVRTCRANGIPARLILGRWAASEVPAKGQEPRNGQYHVKAEAFIEGVGWVGADLSGGVGIEGNPFVCFGQEPGDFIVLDFDVDRLVKKLPEEKPAAIGGSQLYYYWWYTNVAGKEPRVGDEHWTVTVLDRHPAITPVHPSWKRPPPSGPHAPVRKEAVK
jgi:hypothetical protein